MRQMIGLCLLSAVALAAEPFIALQAVEPLAVDLRQFGGLHPGTAVGVRFSETGLLGLRAAGFGGYAPGRPNSGGYLRLVLGARLGVEVMLHQPLEVYVLPSLMLVHARERFNEYRSDSSLILATWHGGTSLGVGLAVGLRLARSAAWQLDFETGLETAGVPTERVVGDPYWPDYYTIPLSSVHAGLVVRRRSGQRR